MIKYTEEQLNRSGIYKITNTINGKFYIGSAVNFGKRWKNKYNKHLTASFVKYGREAFNFEILLFCKGDKEALLFYEQRAIDVYKPEYNMCPIAGSLLGFKHSNKTKQKMSAARKGKPNPKLSAALKGIPKSDEHKQNMSAAQKGKPKPKVSAALKGKKLSEETRANISTAKGITPELETKVCQDYQKEKQSFRALGRKYKISRATVKKILIRNNII